jgi:hypothetical protein
MKRKTGRRRDNNEQYYTKDNVARALLTKVYEMFDLNTLILLWNRLQELEHS